MTPFQRECVSVRVCVPPRGGMNLFTHSGCGGCFRSMMYVQGEDFEFTDKVSLSFISKYSITPLQLLLQY